MEDEKPAAAKEVLEEFAAAINHLDIVLQRDLSLLTVSQDWSNVPYVGDHVQFLRDQLSQLSAALRIIPQPSSAP